MAEVMKHLLKLDLSKGGFVGGPSLREEINITPCEIPPFIPQKIPKTITKLTLRNKS